jgi:DNA topoisomerase I-like protein
MASDLALRVVERFLRAAEEANERGRFEAMALIGKAAVDSGSLLVIDPCYLEHWGSGEHPDLSNDGYHKAVQEGRQQLYFANGGTAAVLVRGFGGDGTYPVLVENRPQGQPPIGSFAVDFQTSKTASNETFALRVAAKYKDKKKTEKGNTVYMYSEKQIAARNRKKAERIEKLRKGIEKLRAKVKKDLHSQDPEKTLTALAVALMDCTYERVGNDESAKDGHFGVTGWKKKHVSISSKGATIKYVGKSNVKHEKKVSDAAVRSALKDAYDAVEGDDDEILSWDGGRVTAEKVNKYLAQFDITAKDLRGFHANREMQERLKEVRKGGGKLPEDKKKREKQLKAEFKEALEGAADAVGHEASTLRSQYLVPGLEEDYLKDGTVSDKLT